jgi:ubiquinone/menaquinone biosynthesis C-methylase UbiE/uncharacterized membrane protein YphA (DoxX/SURF4 family)
VWGLRIVLAAVFAAAGATKLLALPDAVEAFERLGAGHWLRVLVGVLELSGGLGLLVTPLAPLAAAGLALVMVGAVLSVVFVLAPGSPEALAPLATLALCAVVAAAEWRNLGLLRALRAGKGPMDGWIAHVYDRGIQAAFGDVVEPLVTEVAGDLARASGAGPRAGLRILDAGCGPGQFTLLVAKALPGAEVWGIDLAPTMIEIACRHARDAGATRVHFEVADVARLPFRDSTFDAVISSGSIKHWPDPVAGLRELHRVLVPGGRAFVAEMNRLAPPDAVRAQGRRARHWFCRWIYPRVLEKALSPEEARAVFAASPFRGIAAERTILDGCVWMIEAHRPG